MNAVLKSGHTVPQQYRTQPAVSVASPAQRPAKKRHPWGAYMPGQFRSDANRRQQIIPTHARPLR